MSDTEDDFVEVSGYSSDSDWENISGYGSAEETAPVTANTAHKLSPELVASYYNLPEPRYKKLQEQVVPTAVTHEETRGTSSEEERARYSKTKKSQSKKRNWTKVSLKKGHGAPYDPVEFLGITGDEKVLLGHFSITTIGQLAYLNAIDFASSIESDKFAVLLDLQERAYQAVTEYVSKTSTQPDIVWGYIYMGDKAVNQMLQKGYLDSDSLHFLWTPMPATTYRDQLAIDTLVGTEMNDRELRTRYSRFVKINLTKLCNNYYGRLYQKDPSSAATNKWISVTLLEAAEMSQREDLWFSFVAGNEVYSTMTHGSIVIPTGRILQDCVELDRSTCTFASNTDEIESSDDDRDETNPTLVARLEDFV